MTPQRLRGWAVWVGRNAGSGLANLLTNFDVDLNAEVQAADGRVDTIIFAELNGWQPGQTGNQAREVRLNFLSGDQGPQGEFLVDRNGYVDSSRGGTSGSFEAATTWGVGDSDRRIFAELPG